MWHPATRWSESAQLQNTDASKSRTAQPKCAAHMRKSRFMCGTKTTTTTTTTTKMIYKSHSNVHPRTPSASSSASSAILIWTPYRMEITQISNITHTLTHTCPNYYIFVCDCICTMLRCNLCRYECNIWSTCNHKSNHFCVECESHFDNIVRHQFLCWK